MEQSDSHSPFQDFLSAFFDRLSHLLPMGRDIHQLFHGVMSFLEKAIEVRSGLLALIDEGRYLVVEYIYGSDLQGTRGNHLPLYQGRGGESLRHRRPLALHDPSDEPLLGGCSSLGDAPHALFIWAPLFWLGEPLGLLGTHHPHPVWERELLIETMGTVASILAPALAAMILWERPSLDELIRKKLEMVTTKMDPQVEKGASLMAEIVALVERGLIKAALQKTNGVQIAAARLLGINRNTLRKKIKELGIKVP